MKACVHWNLTSLTRLDEGRIGFDRIIGNAIGAKYDILWLAARLQPVKGYRKGERSFARHHRLAAEFYSRTRPDLRKDRFRPARLVAIGNLPSEVPIAEPILSNTASAGLSGTLPTNMNGRGSGTLLLLGYKSGAGAQIGRARLNGDPCSTT